MNEYEVDQLKEAVDELAGLYKRVELTVAEKAGREGSELQAAKAYKRSVQQRAVASKFYGWSQSDFKSLEMVPQEVLPEDRSLFADAVKKCSDRAEKLKGHSYNAAKRLLTDLEGAQGGDTGVVTSDTQAK